jgi:hypothetical protein
LVIVEQAHRGGADVDERASWITGQARRQLELELESRSRGVDRLAG